MNERESLIWAAGLFEGEGCLSVRFTNRRWRYARLTLVMTDEDVVRRWHGIMGGLFYGPLKPGKKSKRPVYKVAINRWHALCIAVRAMYPYLGKRRRDRIRYILKNFKPLRERHVAKELPASCGYCSTDASTTKGVQYHRKNGTPLCVGCWAASHRYYVSYAAKKQRTKPSVNTT